MESRGSSTYGSPLRVLRPLLRQAIVTISTRLADGRPGGPPISVAALFAPVDGGGGATEVVGLTGLVDYVVIGKRVTVHAEVTTADGQHGADERSVDVLAPIDYRCTADAGGPTCDALCGEAHCFMCELGLPDVGYINRVDASSAIVTSCTTALDVDAVQVFACCCCR